MKNKKYINEVCMYSGINFKTKNKKFVDEKFTTDCKTTLRCAVLIGSCVLHEINFRMYKSPIYKLLPLSSRDTAGSFQTEMRKPRAEGHSESHHKMKQQIFTLSPMMKSLFDEC